MPADRDPISHNPVPRDPVDPPEHAPEHPALLTPSVGRLIVVDLQIGLLPHMDGANELAARAALLIRGAQALGVEVRASEQAPDKLGQAGDAVLEALQAADVTPAAKRNFGAAAAVRLTEAETDGRHQAVLCGVETHVCVAQTALELMSAGYAVSVAADACGSRRRFDHEIALQRLSAEGATVTTAEAVLFEWCRTAEHPAFRTLRDLVKSA